jgi:propanediol dehydratase small subunit
MTNKLTTADYPLSEKRPELVRGKRGRAAEDITLDAIESGEAHMDDLRITGEALRQQAEIARAANRPTLASNFERAAELVDVPQDFIMEIYELLRPGRAQSREELVRVSRTLRQDFGAEAMADFIDEAAATYERRGLFTYRF